jgi:hypothetical protein
MLVISSKKLLNFSRKCLKNMIPATESGIMERGARLLVHDKSDVFSCWFRG